MTGKLIVLFALLGSVLYAKPEYTLLSGNRCINCHYDSNGGGIRNDLGWYSTKDNALIKPEDIGLKELTEYVGSNNIIEDKLSVGFDARIQSAKLGGPRGSERDIFLMQASPYVKVKPLSWLEFYGKYNFSDRTYTGQSNYGFDIKIQPGWQYPYIRVGFIQPLIGNRYDDHTMMLKNSTGVFWSSPMAPPDYHEYGAEIGYESVKWLGLYAGVYQTAQLSEIQFLGNTGQPFLLSEDDNLSSAVKIKLNKNFFRNTFITELGSSYFFNESFDMFNIYFNLGWTDKISFLSELALSTRTDFQKVNNYMAQVSYQLISPVILYARYENATTDIIDGNIDNTYSAEQIVLGSSLKVFPFIELRPEYRIFDRANYESYAAQYTVQLHLYY